MKPKQSRTFMCDFETTVFEGQDYTEVWASACVEFYTEDVQIFHSIDEQFQYFLSLDSNIIAYYHNLKFDGTFWLDYLLLQLKLEQAYSKLNEEGTMVEWIEDKFMHSNTFKYAISDMGQWYNIKIKVGQHMIEIRDSLKLLPFSVKRIGKAFKTKHQKLDMEYVGFRYAGCEITDDEKEYIANDVLVVKEALEIMFNQGHSSLTIGTCCLNEFKKTHDRIDYKNFFPDLYEMELDNNLYGSPNVGEYIRRSYRGGWCYLAEGKANKIYTKGTTADVNSLYPSMMSSESGNRYPIGKPKFWKGNFIPDEALNLNRYYFIRVKTRFYLKENMLPFIQIKGNILYKATEMLKSSDALNKKTGTYHDHYLDPFGNRHSTEVIMTLTMTDFELIKEHYELVDFEILDGCIFYTHTGLFDEYIEKYKKIKLESKGAMRELAKLFLNNLYGKMASNTNSSFKVAFGTPEHSISFFAVPEYKKKAGYIPIGSAITSYARNFTIRAAQKNYHGVDQRGFIYADTDSIHCDLVPDEIQGITVHDKNFCCWKLESCWDKAIFVRQKTYIEHITHEDLEPIEKPYNNIKCAGMPQKCKDLLDLSMNGYEAKEGDDYTEEQLEFLKTKRTLEDFKVGLIVPGKLLPRRIKGGTILVETTYEMR